MVRNKYLPKGLNILLYFTIALGCLQRCALYFQNRSIIGDEANVIRNIYERNLSELLLPLDYNQFAPPGFLWMLKISTILFGYSEYALRLYPVLCSIGCLIILLLVLRRIAKPEVIWYPIVLLATGLFYIRYGTEIKQYASDMFIALLIVLISLKTDIQKTTALKFIVILGITGSVAIWFSMPSVFILAASGAYYFCHVVRARSFKKMLPLAVTALIWAGQFFVYYKILLVTQTHSDYLQAWHNMYFPALMPRNAADFQHNSGLYLSMFNNLGGNTVLAIVFNLILMLIGFIYLFIKDIAKAVLFAVPVICLHVAAGLHSFTLLPRVTLFILPLLLVVCAVGMQQLFNIKSLISKAIITIIAIICFINFNELHYVYDHFEVEDFKGGLDIAKKQNIEKGHFHVGMLLEPCYIYYLKISPERTRWPLFADADITRREMNYDSLGQTFTGKNAIIYTWMDDNDLNTELTALRKHAYQDGVLWFPGGNLYIFTKLNHNDSLLKNLK